MKKYLCLLVAVLLVLTDAMAENVFRVGNLWYTDTYMGSKLAEDEVCVTASPEGSIYYDSTITVPAKVEYNGREYNVVNIRHEAFYQCYLLEELIIEAPIKELKDLGCDHCYNLRRVVFPGILELLGGFEDCTHLEYVVLPDNLKKIYWRSFQFCNIRSLKFPHGFEAVAQYSFMYSAIDEIEFKGVKVFFDEAFSRLAKAPTVLKFPSSLLHFAYYSFSFNELDEIWLEEPAGDYVLSFDYGAFYNTSASRIYCNSRRVPRLYGPAPWLEENPEPYDPSSGEVPLVFPFKNPDNGISNLADLKSIKLYVPEGCRELYQAHHYWGNFDIEEMDFSAGVAETLSDVADPFRAVAGEGLIEFEAVEDVDINVYDASGRSVAIARLVAGDNRTLSLPAGIYIAVASGHSVKVAVR